MPMVFQACYECGEEIYFQENPHVSRDVDFVTLPPMPCDDCDQVYYEMLMHSGMNEDDCF